MVHPELLSALCQDALPFAWFTAGLEATMLNGTDINTWLSHVMIAA